MNPVRIANVEASLGYRQLSDVQIAPDGASVAVVDAAMSAEVNETEPPRRILVFSADGLEWQHITAGGRLETAPRWSPDGHTLAFLSDIAAPGSFAVHLWRTEDGRIRPLLAPGATWPGDLHGSVLHTAAIAAPCWASTSDALAVLFPDDAASASVMGAGALGIGVSPSRNRICTIGLDAGAPTIIPADVHVWEFDWSPDGEHFAAVASTNADEAAWYTAALCLIDRSGRAETLFDPSSAGPGAVRGIGRQLADPHFSPDGQLLAFLCCTWSDRGLVGGDVYVVGADGGSPRNLTAGRQISVSATQWLPDGCGLLAASWVEGEQAILRLRVNGGEPEILWRGQAAFAERACPRFSVSRQSTLAVAREDHASPPEVWLMDVKDAAKWRKITALQPTRQLELSSLETLTWRSRDGTPIQGHLLLPPDPNDSPSPLVVFPHGGPIMLHQYLFHGRIEGPYGIPFELFPANGIALLLPNPRGSLGWGTEFAEAMSGSLGHNDLDDVIAGVDAVVEAGYADNNRVGIAGWSSAGYLAAWATCKTQRFAAALVGGAYVDIRGLYATAPPYVRLFHGSNVFAPAGLDHQSPLAHADQVVTPTLIAHCEHDLLINPTQALLWYRALRERRVAVELAIYPGESHAIKHAANQIDFGRRVITWFSRWFSKQ